MRANPQVTPVIAEAIPRSFREAIRRVGLSAQELAMLAKMEPSRVAFDFTVTLALILAIPIAYRYMPNPVTFVVCVLASLHVFNRLASLIHMSDHNALLPGPRANSILGSFAAFFMGYTRHGHRAVHQEHHLHLNTPEDPDKIWGVPEERTRDVFAKWISDLLFSSAARRLLQYVQPRRRRQRMPAADPVLLRAVRAIRLQLPVFPVQLFLVAYYHWVIGWQYYILFYVLPILTLYPAIIRLRSVVEHSFEIGYVPQSPDQCFVIRSTNANLFERLIIAPLNGEYHLEHHLLPTVPYYKLPAARKIIESKGVQVPLADGYFSYFVDKWRKEQAAAKLAGTGPGGNPPSAGL